MKHTSTNGCDNILRSEQNGGHLANGIFESNFLQDEFYILPFTPTFVYVSTIDSWSGLFRVAEPMMTQFTDDRMRH